MFVVVCEAGTPHLLYFHCFLSHSPCDNECSGEESFHEGERTTCVTVMLFVQSVDLPGPVTFQVLDLHYIAFQIFSASVLLSPL